MEKWFIKNKKADFSLIARQFGIREVTARIAVNRGISSAEQMEQYLRPDIQQMEAPDHMKDLVKACEILKEKIEAGKRIRVIGDYDVDGVMSTYILITVLKKCGAHVDYEIPDRIKDGYGVNISIIQAAYEDGIDTIITCDNGIAAFEQMEHAGKLGITTIITDHHDIPFNEIDGEKVHIVPNADAVVNPKQPNCSYSFKNLCGAGVTYKMAQYLYNMFGLDGLDELLEFAAIATVCDVMDLTGENRTFVQYGLKAVSQSKNFGIQALLRENGLEDKKISSYHFGFVIGPCINASGRLESAKLALRMFLTDNMETATEYAKKLKELNEERKELTNQGIVEACQQAEEQYMNDKVLVIYLENCHESIAGIIAGRVRERYNKPTLVLTKAEEGVKGSGRSIEAYNMFEKLNECKELLDKFGGHPLAAGLSLQAEKVPILRKQLNENSGLSEEDLVKKVSFDMVLPFEEVDFQLLDEIERLEPFGKANEKPLFALKDVKLINAKILGKDKNVLKLTVSSKGSRNIYTAMLFNNLEQFEERLSEKYGENAVSGLYAGASQDIYMDIVFYPNRNDYNGRSTIQYIIQHFR